VKLLMEAGDLRARLVEEIRREELHRGLETEKIIAVLLEACAEGQLPDVAALAQALEDRDRRLLLEIAFEGSPGTGWEEAESCLEVLHRRRAEEELAAVQRQIEAQPVAAAGQGDDLRQLLVRKQELRRRLSEPPA